MIELNRIYNEDCLKGMKRIPDKSVDMILCDLPYGTTQNKWDIILPFKQLWKQYKKIIKDNGVIALTSSQPFTSKLIMSNLKMFRYEWIWEKKNATGFLNSKKMPLKKHENILVFYKKNKTYNPQDLIYNPKIQRRGSIGDNYGKAKNHNVSEYENYPADILHFDYDKSKLHPTQKPVALFEYLIRTYTNESETVLDNCIGSGTTAIACINTNRNYIGFELDKQYYDIAQNRINEHIAKEGVYVR